MMALSITNDQTFLLFFSFPPIISFENIFTVLKTWPFAIIIGLFFLGLFTYWASTSPGGPAWKDGRNHMGRVPIPGPKGLPIFGSLFSLSHGLAHRTLASMAQGIAAKQLMALSLGSTPMVVTSDPEIAREILTSPYFADRPIKESAKQLMFSRAIGFAPSGTHWRLLRRIAASHLFSPRRILAHEGGRMLECASLVDSILKEQVLHGAVSIRRHLQAAALNNIMGSVFGKRYDFMMHENMSGEAAQLHELVKEGFELLGAFNWSDHLPWLKYFCDPCGVVQRCSALVPRVRTLVGKIIDEHRERRMKNNGNTSSSEMSDFVDVLLSLDGEEKLEEDDMVAVLWEMIFRGTDTIALSIEWIIAEIILNPMVQSKLESEVSNAIANGATSSVIAKLPYLQAVVKETLRLHPPGPLLSWARISIIDVNLTNGMVVPKGTTTMVNMWSITHDPEVWDNSYMFNPERFLKSTSNGIDVDVRGSDLRLAPFGAGRRVCPGKDLALVTVSQWVAKLVYNFKWLHDEAYPVDLSEELKLSCEMKYPLSAVAIPRNCFGAKQY